MRGCLLFLLPATALLTSCGFFRLPDPSPEFRQAHFQRVAVSQRATASKKQPPKDPDVLIWLIADNLHTGLVFPYDWLLESGFIPPKNFGNPRFVTLSWGNRTAYVERGLDTIGEVLTALFTNSPAVMELIPVDYEVVDQCPHQRIYRKLVPREKGPELALFLNWCSAQDPEGRPIVCGTSSWGDGLLLESRHTYYLPRICNIWTMQAMESIGDRMRYIPSTLADGVIYQATRQKGNPYEQIWFGTEKKP
ncbi:MAG: DUF2459 domain-containing protein [Luteolibacter sp.]